MKRYDPWQEFRMGSIFNSMHPDPFGEYVKYEDAAKLLAALDRLSKFFVGMYEKDPRSDKEIQEDRAAAEKFAMDILENMK